jgi:hypothetical protein
VVLRFQNPDLEEENVGSKHERAWRELAADLLEEVLEKGQQGEEGDGGQPTFSVDDACTIVVTDMCVAFVVGHLQDEHTDLGSYKRTLNFLQLDVDKRDAWQALVSLRCSFDERQELVYSSVQDRARLVIVSV